MAMHGLDLHYAKHAPLGCPACLRVPTKCMHVNCVANRARLPEAAKATVLAVAARTTAFALTHADAMWPQRCTPLGVEQLCRACSLQEQSRTPWRTRNIKLSAHDTQALFKIIVEAWSGSCGGCVRVQDCKSLGVGGDCLGMFSNGMLLVHSPRKPCPS
jgi:hypothetical protein